jgi:hypothetical protein
VMGRSGDWPVLQSPEDADATHRWARECLAMWEAERERLRSAVQLAIVGFEVLIDPDPQRGILTNVRLQGEQQGVDLTATYDAVVEMVAVLRAELGADGEQSLRGRTEA